MKNPQWKRNLSLTAAMLGTLAGAQTYSGPKAVVYIGDKWCRGGYCSGSVYAAFEEAMNRALTASGYVEAVRKQEGAPLQMAGGVTDVSSSSSVCLPFVGCLRGKTVRASMELTDAASGTVKWNESCEGTSGGVSTWGWWGGSMYLDSDEGKAVADCAGKLVQKLTASGALTPYLGRTGPVQAVAAPAAPASPAAPAAQTSQPVEQLGSLLKTLAFADMNALFTSDPYNPVKVKELNAAATSATLASASGVQFKVTSTENAGAYTLVGVTYTLPGGQEKFVQLAVTADSGLNPRGGTRLLYLSAFNPLRTSTPALDGLSRNVETLLGDLHAALGLPGL